MTVIILRYIYRSYSYITQNFSLRKYIVICNSTQKVGNLQRRSQSTFIINFVLVDVQYYDCIFSFVFIKYHGIDKKKKKRNA